MLLILTALFTSALSAVLGMAGGLVLMAISATLLPVAAAMVFQGSVQLVANGGRALMLWRHIRWRSVGTYAAGAALAMLAMRQVAWRPDADAVLLLLGLTPFAARLLPPFDFTRRDHAIFCGALVAGVQILAGVAGPLLDVFFVDSPLDRRGVVACKAATQTLSHAIKLGFWAPLLVNGEPSPALILGACVAAVLGTALGRRLLERFSEGSFRKATRWTVMGIGAACIAQSLW